VKEHPEKYKFFPEKIRFDYLDNDVPYCHFQSGAIEDKLYKYFKN
jgi:hypothetical protein